MNRLTLSRLWKFLRNAVAAVCGLVLVIALLPSKARSQLGLDPCCAMMQVGLNTISGLLRNAVAQPLGSIQQSQQQSANYEQQVVFPLTAITQARNMAVQFQSQFVQMRQLFQLPISSATLRTPQLLEQSLLSGNPGAMPQITSNYSALYGSVMPPANAPQSVRNMVDMTDAEAQAAMKKAVEIDALANLELQAAEQINQQLQSAAPGSSTILEAETAAWLVRANAYTQSAMAELVRVRSIELANSSGQLKFSASHAATLQTTGNQVSATGSPVAVFYFQQLLNNALAWDRRHRDHLDGHEHRIRDPADWLPDRPLSSGISWRRFAGACGNGDQVSDRCHDRLQLGDRVSRRQRLLQHGREFHRQQFRCRRHVPELDGTAPTTVRKQSFVDPYGHHHGRCSRHHHGGPARSCLSSLCPRDDRVLLFLHACLAQSSTWSALWCSRLFPSRGSASWGSRMPSM